MHLQKISCTSNTRKQNHGNWKCPHPASPRPKLPSTYAVGIREEVRMRFHAQTFLEEHYEKPKSNINTVYSECVFQNGPTRNAYNTLEIVSIKA